MILTARRLRAALSLTLAALAGTAAAQPAPGSAPGHAKDSEALRHVAPDAPAFAACYLRAYPEQLCGATATDLVWCDGTRMPWRRRAATGALDEATMGEADLADQVSEGYPVHPHWRGPATSDPGRYRYDPFFLKMYGDSARAVGARTRKVRWAVGKGPPGTLKVTTVNGVADRLERVVAAVSRLPAADRQAVATTAGAFVWRTIKGTDRLSLHSFAIAVDVGVPQSDYWRWVKPGPDGQRAWRNRIPASVAAAFEAEGFIWGAKWLHFDTMHFEYRPELLDPACADAASRGGAREALDGPGPGR